MAFSTGLARAATCALGAAALVVAVPGDARATSDPAPPDAEGTLTIVSGGSPTTELREGDSGTAFALRPPDGAVCPGDSLNDQWRVQSFIVPAAVDPAEIEFDGAGPSAPGQHALYSLGRPYVDVLTAPNDRPGMPAPLVVTPPFTLAVHPPGTLPPGAYRIGLACTLSRQVAASWTVEVQLTVAPDVVPGERRWSVTAPSRSATDERAGATPSGWMVAVGAVVVLGLAVVVAAMSSGRHRRASAPAPRDARGSVRHRDGDDERDVRATSSGARR